ncbi:uncharacterized protein LOC129220133 isoform X2 [Uloborus diversus]|nr:uncharacterized protein LOC129220133 isoform X2 [Uloborus diversus]XP_054710454.1 uncharacterized protein LOC129220133 isoform X2 [Uloborus diversus]
MRPTLISTFLVIIAFSEGVSSTSRREKSTEKPYAPPSLNDPYSPKHQHSSTHISDFTDPGTGLNPFIDLEEGDFPNGRNVMEDERRDDFDPIMDFDPVEGEATGRKWGFDYNEKPMEKPIRRPIFEVEKNDNTPIPSTSSVQVQTTTEETLTSASDEVILQEDNLTDVEQNEKESIMFSKDTVIYASVTTAAVAAIALLVGACWWKRKLKRISHTPVEMENGELKS